MSNSKPFPGAPTKGFFFQIKTAEVAGKLSGMPGKIGKIGKMYGTLSRFLAHNEYPYFVLFTETMKVYETKHKPFWDGLLPSINKLQSSDNEVLLEQYMDRTYGPGWEKAEEGLAYISALLRFSKDNPTGVEVEEIHILSCLLWSIYISVHENSLFDELYGIFQRVEKVHGHSIKSNFNPTLN